MQPVFINSLPKSGTNLVARCLDLFGYNQKLHIGNRIKDPNSGINNLLLNIPPFIQTGYLVGIDMPVLRRKKNIQKYIRNIKNHEYITGHIGPSIELLNYIINRELKICFVIRDPRAVISSSVNYILKKKHHSLYGEFKLMSFEERYLAVIYGVKKHNYQSIEDRYRFIRNWIDSSKVLTIRFEDLIGVKGGGSELRMYDSIRSIATHVDADLNKIDYVQNKLFGFDRGNFNKGQISSWKEDIPEKIRIIIEDELSNLIKKLGYND